MLLGRRFECAALDELMNAVRAGQSRVLVLRGEPPGRSSSPATPAPSRCCPSHCITSRA
jgi:hypothetical protein